VIRSESGQAYVSQEEERKEVHESVRQLLVLFQSNPNLFPADCGIVLALRQRRTRTGLLVDD
jgi:hypothetical protein